MNKSRPKQTTFRMSEQEAEQLRHNIQRSGLNQQEYIIRAVLNAPIADTSNIKELLPELKRVGNNLNQIAKALNAKQFYSYPKIEQNQKELLQLWQLLRQYLQKPVSDEQ